jgi:hypothetical protein
MEFVFCLSDAASFAWGTGGVWLTKGAAWFADDPFVLAHPELFSPVPPSVNSSTGRLVEQVPLSAQPTSATAARRGRNG